MKERLMKCAQVIRDMVIFLLCIFCTFASFGVQVCEVILSYWLYRNDFLSHLIYYCLFWDKITSFKVECAKTDSIYLIGSDKQSVGTCIMRNESIQHIYACSFWGTFVVKLMPWMTFSYLATCAQPRTPPIGISPPWLLPQRKQHNPLFLTGPYDRIIRMIQLLFPLNISEFRAGTSQGAQKIFIHHFFILGWDQEM